MGALEYIAERARAFPGADKVRTLPVIQQLQPILQRMRDNPMDMGDIAVEAAVDTIGSHVANSSAAKWLDKNITRPYVDPIVSNLRARNVVYESGGTPGWPWTGYEAPRVMPGMQIKAEKPQVEVNPDEGFDEIVKKYKLKQRSQDNKLGE